MVIKEFYQNFFTYMIEHFINLFFCLEICEKSGTAGNAPHESDLTKYYQCVKNNASGKWILVYLRDCPSGTIFIPQSERCGRKPSPQLPLESTPRPESTTPEPTNYPETTLQNLEPVTNPNTEIPAEDPRQRINGN